ncbi:MAG TPA: hypothetical protein VJ023_10605, partial [Pyrinomonadaceae bacterium]|nr:hypothetical protein [Pyrinomonadaceae bacterium]
MKSQKITLLLVAGLFVTLGVTYSQNRRRQGHGMPRYDTATEVTMWGTVEGIENQTGKMGWNGTHLIVKFEAETLTVHLGPSNYLVQQRFSFAKGDWIKVTGSKIKFEGANVLVAREIRKAEKVLTLRNRHGIP